MFIIKILPRADDFFIHLHVFWKNDWKFNIFYIFRTENFPREIRRHHICGYVAAKKHSRKLYCTVYEKENWVFSAFQLEPLFNRKIFSRRKLETRKKKRKREKKDRIKLLWKIGSFAKKKLSIKRVAFYILLPRLQNWKKKGAWTRSSIIVSYRVTKKRKRRFDKRLFFLDLQFCLRQAKKVERRE